MSEDLLSALHDRLEVADLLPEAIEKLLEAVELDGAGAPDVVGDLTTLAGNGVPSPGAVLPGLTGLPFGAPELPPLPAGLPVKLSLETAGAGLPRWAVVLAPGSLTVPLPNLSPAEAVPEGEPTELRPIGSPGEPENQVLLSCEAALRIMATGGATPRVELVDVEEAARHPFAAAGALPKLELEPTSFFIGESKFGLTVEDLAWDASGLSLRRATLYLPPGAPVIGDARAVVEDLLIGNPSGVKGTASATLGADGKPRAEAEAEAADAGVTTKIEVEWDDPSARGLAEATPSRAEATVTWAGDEVPLPAGPAPLTSPDGARPSEWKLRGNWGHDRTDGSDEFTLALDVAGSPDGIAAVSSKTLAGALGLAPAVIGSADPSGDAAMIAALLGALGGAAGLLRDDSRVVVVGLEIDHLERAAGAGSRTRLTVDYTVALSVEVGGGSLGVQTRVGQPLRLRYRGVHADFDTDGDPWYETLGLSFDGATPEVVDPGSWEVGEPLGELLRVLGVRSGAGSGWLELDLAMAADLGVVKLSNAIVRVVFDGPGIEVELRGLTASVDVAGVVEGEGSLAVGNGAIQAALKLDVVPLKVAALANLTLDGDMVELEIGVRFPAPLPFANSGLGLFGLAGRFVANGERSIDSGQADPVKRELDWLGKSDKYKRGEQYAMGLGAMVGTVPDAGFTFHAMGMLTVEFPRPTVIFSVVAALLKEPAPVPEETVPPPDYGISIIGLVVIGDPGNPADGVSVALRGRYEVPHIFVADMPIGAWFPYGEPAASWLHVGTDGQPGREGAPVTVTLLPGILDQTVWAFAMVHGKGISPGLKGNADFAFEGFAIGFGAGWEIDWSAGPIRLQAGAMVLAGFGTDPLRLAAGIWVRGSLDLVVLSIAARGEITLLASAGKIRLHGELCGEVDLFFFSLSGCVGITIGPEDVGKPPPPDSPVSGVDLVSRLGYVTATAAREGEGSPPPVWPDAYPVIHFAHFVDSAGVVSDFGIGTPMPGPVWSGSRELKYAFRITGVRLEAVDGSPFDPPAGKPFDSAWWWPGVRAKEAPSPHLAAVGIDTRDLALLTWEPWGGLLPLTEPTKSPANPEAPLHEVCEVVPKAAAICVWGEIGRGAGPGAAELSEPWADAEPAGRPRTRMLLAQPGDGDWSDVLVAAASLGLAVTPAEPRQLDRAVEGADGTVREKGWQLAGLARNGTMLGTLAARGRFEPPLEDVVLTLEVCPGPSYEGMEGERLYDGLERPSAWIPLARLEPGRLIACTDPAGVLTWKGLRIAALSGARLEVAAAADGWGLRVPDGGLEVRLANPTNVSGVGLAGPGNARLVAYDVAGVEVGETGGEGAGELPIEGRLLRRLLIYSDGETLLERVLAADPFGVSSTLLDEHPPLGTEVPEEPAVIGIRVDGSEEPWKREEGERGRECGQMVYRAPDSGPWLEARIGTARRCRVKVVGACGVRWHDAIERRRADESRLGLLNALNAHATGPAGFNRSTVAAQAALPLALPIAAPPAVAAPPRQLFAAGKSYRVAVDWQWQEWRPKAKEIAPGPPDPNGWVDGGSDSFVFTTAGAGSSDPVELIGEQTFDPRGTARYVTGAAPSGELPHLLDDPIRIEFDVDYLPALLAEYGYEARIEVHPTDVAPGSLKFDPHTADVVTSIELLAWAAGLTATEQTIVDAVGPSGRWTCTPDTSLGGLAAEVKAKLEPRTGYDLTLRARPKGPPAGPEDGSADVVISRFHFRTALHRDIGEVLAALGFFAAAAGPPPGDVLLTGWTPPGAAHFDDFALQAALGAVGLDPWPLAGTPRTTTLWTAPEAGDTGWRLAGVLLESPEPIAREGRIKVSGAIGGLAFDHRLGTANGTRVLLVPPAPFVPGPGDDLLTVELTDNLGPDTTASGSVELGAVPATIVAELA
jgi:hypothetical protein